MDFLESRIKNAERTMMNNLSTSAYSDGTGSSSKEIGGLQLLIADTPTNAFYRNISFDATTDGGAAADSANIQSYMNRVWVQVVRGRDMPDLIVADNAYWRLYLESLQAIQRISSDRMAQAGFMSLKYMN